MTHTRFSYRHQYDDARDQIEREACDICCTDPSLAQQQYTDEVNLNIMVARMGLTDGALPPAVLDPRFYGDFSNALDLRDIFDQVREATNMFNQLPADLRRRFDHDPAQLLMFVEDPENHAEAVKLGLLADTSKPDNKEAPPLDPQTDTPK